MTDPARVYAIGDIHGQLEMLLAVHEAIAKDLRANPCHGHLVVHVGDYVDRGPDSKGVLDWLIAQEAAGAPHINLLGNHDRMFRIFLEEPGGRDPILRRQFHWMHHRLGGAETLRSYGLDLPAEVAVEDEAAWSGAAANVVPQEHRAFIAGLRDSFHWGSWFFAHAGVSPGVALAMQDEDDLIWIRDAFLNSKRDHGATVIHGHTPVEFVEDHGNRIAIDTGAAFGGPLSCIALESDSARILGGAQLR